VFDLDRQAVVAARDATLSVSDARAVLLELNAYRGEATLRLCDAPLLLGLLITRQPPRLGVPRSRWRCCRSQESAIRKAPRTLRSSRRSRACRLAAVLNRERDDRDRRDDQCSCRQPDRTTEHAGSAARSRRRRCVPVTLCCVVELSSCAHGVANARRRCDRYCGVGRTLIGGEFHASGGSCSPASSNRSSSAAAGRATRPRTSMRSLSGAVGRRPRETANGPPGPLHRLRQATRPEPSRP
jgi:hypothetical protein